MTLLFIVSHRRTATFTWCDLLVSHSIFVYRHAGGCLLLQLPAVFTMWVPEVLWYLSDSSAAPLLPHGCAACSRYFGTREKAEVAFKT